MSPSAAPPGRGAAGGAGPPVQLQGGAEPAGELHDLELEQERSRRAASELQAELLSREQELVEAQRSGAQEAAGARVELKESQRRAELLEAMVGALRERLKREEERNTALAVEIEAGRLELAESQGQRREMQQRIADLRAELADAQLKLSSAAARASQLESHVAQLVERNTLLEERVGELEAKLQTRAGQVAATATDAEDRLRMLQAAADEDRLAIAKLQSALADRESQLAALREGEAELQQVLEQSKAAAAQMGLLLKNRESEVQRLQAALKEAQQRRGVQAEALNEQIAKLEKQREAEVQRLREALLEAEKRKLAETDELRKKVEALQRQREEEMQRLWQSGATASRAALEEVEALQEQLESMQAERDREVGLLSSQLQESVAHATSLREAAKAQAGAQAAEVQEMRRQLEDAKLRAEQSAARRVAEVSELRAALEQQVGAARSEAEAARGQLQAVKAQLDGLLSEEFLELLEDELRRSVLPGTQPPPKPPPPTSPEHAQALRSLDSREGALRQQLEALQTELAELQAGAVARLGPAMVTRARELEGTAAQCRRALRAREAVGDQQGAQRVSQQLSTATAELAALYRTVMLPEARLRERAVRLELQDREMELRGVVEQQVRLQDRLEQERSAREETRQKALASASGPSQQQLRKAVQARVRELMQERDRKLEKHAAAREQQLQAQLQSAVSASLDTAAQQREQRAVREAVERQARALEESWRAQLEASSQALQEAAADKQRLAQEVGRSATQVREQLAALDSLRKELLAARATISALRRTAEGSQQAASQQSAGAVAEVRRLAEQVHQLQTALEERERQFAVASQGAALPPAGLGPPGLRSRQGAQLPGAAAAALPAAPATVTPARAVVPVQKLSPAAQPPAATAVGRRLMPAAAAAGTLAARPAAPTRPDGGGGGSTGGSGLGSGAATDRAPTVKPETAVSSPASGWSDKGSAGFVPITPVKPGWPAQYGGKAGSAVPPPPPLPPAQAPADAAKTPSGVPIANGAGKGPAARSATSGAAPHTGTAAGTGTSGTSTGRSLPNPAPASSPTTGGDSARPSPPGATASPGAGAPENRNAAGTGFVGAGATGEGVAARGPAGSGTSSSRTDSAPGPLRAPGSPNGTSHDTIASSGPAAGPGSNGGDGPEGAEARTGEGRAAVAASTDGTRAAREAVWAAGVPSPPVAPGLGVASPESTILAPSGRAAAQAAPQAPAPPSLEPRASSQPVQFVDAAPSSSAAPPGTPLQSGTPQQRPFDATASVLSPAPNPVAAIQPSGLAPPAAAATETALPPLAPAAQAPEAAGTRGSAGAPQTDSSRSPPPPPPAAAAAAAASPAVPPAAGSSAAAGTPPAPPSAAAPSGPVPPPPPVVPLTPLKMPTPEAFGDFVRRAPQGADTGTDDGSNGEPERSGRPTAGRPSPTQPPKGQQGGRSPTPAQSPAAAAMAAAAGAAAAAKRAAAQTPKPSPPKPRDFNTPPIAEWGRPKPSPEEPTGDPSRPSTPGSPSAPSGSPPSGPSGPFFSDAELGAEIAAIAQSIVQRTIGGQPAPGAGAEARDQRGGAAAAATSSSGQGQQPGLPAAGPPGPGRPSQAGPRSASAAPSPAATGPAPSTTSAAPVPPRRLQLSVGACGVPHVGKAERGSEDAYFIVTPASGTIWSGAAAAGPAPVGPISALGVADGVGGWAEENVDPGQYSREVMEVAARMAAESTGPPDPRDLLAEAQGEVRTVGSCTACVAVLGPAGAGAGAGGLNDLLSIANLGDSGVRVVRRGSLVLASSAQEHQFNMPYQMAHPDNLPETDTAADAQSYQLALEPGDVVVLATDGLFDNMWDEELVALAAAAAASVLPPAVSLSGPAALAAAGPAAQQLATALATSAFRHAQDPAFRSPWAVEMANQPAASWLARLFPRGGKMDDITAVVAIVTTA